MQLNRMYLATKIIGFLSIVLLLMSFFVAPVNALLFPTGEVLGATNKNKYVRIAAPGNVILSNRSAVITRVSPADNQILGNVTLITDVLGNAVMNFPDTDPTYVNLRIKPNGYLSLVVPNVNTASADTSVVEANTFVGGDINGDNVINTLDASAVSDDWNRTGSQADINGDGIVNSFDFAIIKENFNKVGQ
jgi:hypothetical protein